jgi:hypothetical protein
MISAWAGIDWVAANHVKPAVATLSLGVQEGRWSQALDTAVRSLVFDHGVCAHSSLSACLLVCDSVRGPLVTLAAMES